MKEFAFGTDEQFAALDQALTISGKPYRFPGRQLPASCQPATACLWFARRDGMYLLCIDKGISTTAPDRCFRDFLEKGEAKFACLADMAAFLRSLQPLFAPAELPAGTDPAAAAAPEGSSVVNAVNKEKLRQIHEAEAAPRPVRPEDISRRLKAAVFGQDAALDALAKKVVINRMHKKPRLLAVALLGPTGTGKSATGRALAQALTEVYGTHFGFLDINANQMVGEHSVHSFFGAPPGYVGHGKPTLLEPVRKEPDHVIVLEEIEKANPTVLVGLMEAVDTGILEMADNSAPINLNRCILLFTSNIPVDGQAYREATPFRQGEICRDAFTHHCGRPEISGKIGNFLVYDELPYEARADIVVKAISDELRDYDLVLRSVDPYLLNGFITQETRYGARPLIALVSDMIGERLLAARTSAAFRGKWVSLHGTVDNIAFEFAEEGEGCEKRTA